MKKDDNFKEERELLRQCYKRCVWTVIILVCLCVVGYFLSSCTTTKYVPVETVKTEYKEVHDTVKIQDSIKNEKQTIIREADSTEIERLNMEYGFKLDKAQRTIIVLRKELEQQNHNLSEVRDSIVYKEKTVQVPYPVERKLSKWEQVKMDYGGKAMIALAIVLYIVIWLIVSKLRR